MYQLAHHVPFTVVPGRVCWLVVWIVVVVDGAHLGVHVEAVQVHSSAAVQRKHDAVEPGGGEVLERAVHVPVPRRVHRVNLLQRVVLAAPHQHLQGRCVADVDVHVLGVALAEPEVARVGQAVRGLHSHMLLEAERGGAVEAKHHLVRVDLAPVLELEHVPGAAHDSARLENASEGRLLCRQRRQKGVRHRPKVDGLVKVRGQARVQRSVALHRSNRQRDVLLVGRVEEGKLALELLGERRAVRAFKDGRASAQRRGDGEGDLPWRAPQPLLMLMVLLVHPRVLLRTARSRPTMLLTERLVSLTQHLLVLTRLASVHLVLLVLPVLSIRRLLVLLRPLVHNRLHLLLTQHVSFLTRCVLLLPQQILLLLLLLLPLSARECILLRGQLAQALADHL
mmetsp:Transcript_26752/g.50959  ORF Transcript_26752/g.50959 Transcript_26752/m.50959 type:complete len:395 (+) Transcript_26752:694-1878(+)